MKKFISLGLILLMLLSVVSCGNNDANSNTSSGSDDAATTEDSGSLTKKSGNVNEFGYEVPEETITFTVFAGYGDQAEFDEDSAWAKEFYKEHFNINFERLLFGIDMNEKLNLMLASNDYPEAITWMSDEMADKFAHQG